MHYIIVPLSKSPQPEGRIGPEELQDWYRQCVKAVQLARRRNAPLVTSSSFVMKDSVSDEEQYGRVISLLGCELVRLGVGDNTIDQLAELKSYARQHGVKIVLVATWLHYLRVKWLCMRENVDADVFISGGMPRPKEAITDLILTILYPLIDLLGKKEAFERYIRSRRALGML